MADKLDLHTALKLASLVTERRATIPILGCVMLVKSVVEATDLDLHLKVVTEITGPKNGMAVDLRSLMAAVKQTGGTAKFDDDRVTLGTDPTVSIMANKGNDWPTLKMPGEKGSEFELPAGQLAADLAAVAPAMGLEETRYYLCGMVWHVVDGALRFAATDGHRLHRISQPAPKGSEKLAESIIPRKAIRVLAKALELEPEASVKIEIKGTKARFTVGAITLTTKLIDGTFPDYRRVIPTLNDKGIRIVASDLTRPAALAAKVLEPEGTNGVALLTKDKRLTGKSPEGTEVNATLALEVFGDPPESVGFRHEYLVDCLTPFGGNTVTMGMADSAAPALIQNPDDDRLLVVLMPMRI